MTCADCEQHIEREIDRIPGVVNTRVDYAEGSAAVEFADRVDLRAVTTAVARAGYHASNVHLSGPTESARNGPSPKRRGATLTGEWLGQLTVGEGKTSELVLDLDRVADRWVGQFDLIDFGVEDYPIQIEVDGSNVRLNLTAAKIDFQGILSARGDSLSGIATSQGHHDQLVLVRSGEPRFSSDFLALESVAEDSTRVASLSPDGAELRRQFNDDRAYTRLLMLLSPT